MGMNPLGKLKQIFGSIDKQLKDLQAAQAQLTATNARLVAEIESLTTNRQEEVLAIAGKLDALEQAFNEHKKLQWHMQYYYDQEWARAENARVEALCPGNHERLLALKDKYKGKRCFIIGNGPSLRAKDLDKLKDEYTFACNRIDLIFDKTDWRPTFYCVTDLNLLKNDFSVKENLQKLQDKSLNLLCSEVLETDRKFRKVCYYAFNRMYRKVPEFSVDASKWLYEGGTVTYIEIQLAVYMGFSDIYLLGVDNTFKTKTLTDGRVVYDWAGQHFAEQYVADTVSDKINAWVDLSDKLSSGLYETEVSYKTAQWHTEQLNVKIWNATRGGALDIFPRVDLDTVLSTHTCQ